MATTGRPYDPPADYVKVDPTNAAAIAAAYDQMAHAPQDPEVKAAYDAMIRETVDQYQAIKRTGLKVSFIEGGDPYRVSPRLMTEDVRRNNHMWVFPTDAGFGSNATVDVRDNPLLAYTNESIGGRRLRANDVFRIVHDYFGHVKEGNGFRADGEENAWRSHAAMYSPLARRAMTTETRGQNSWVNYGPHGVSNRTASSAATVFADQKTGLLPAWVSEDRYPRRSQRPREGYPEFNPDQARDDEGKWTVTPGGPPPDLSPKDYRGTDYLIGPDRTLADVTNEERAQAKRRIVDGLTDAMEPLGPETLRAYIADVKFKPTVTDAELPREVAQELVDQWASTSGDHDAEAVAFQLVAEKHFKLPPSTATSWGDDPPTLERAQGIAARHDKVYRTALDHMYRATQRDLAAKGLTEVTLYRGMGARDFAAVGLTGEAVGSSRLTLQPLSSFSTSAIQAGYFSTQGSNEVATLTAVRVPAARIFSTARTGIGCLNEGEFVLLGGRIQGITAVMDVSMKAAPFSSSELARRLRVEMLKVQEAEPRIALEPDKDERNADWPKRTPDTLADLGITTKTKTPPPANPEGGA